MKAETAFQFVLDKMLEFISLIGKGEFRKKRYLKSFYRIIFLTVNNLIYIQSTLEVKKRSKIPRLDTLTVQRQEHIHDLYLSLKYFVILKYLWYVLNR